MNITTGQQIRIVVDMPTPSLNETQRMHWAKLRRLYQKWQLHVFARAFEARAEPASGKRRVIIERRGKRYLDEDNLFGGCKIVIDALKNEGLLVDDNAENMELKVVQTKPEKGSLPCTIITLEDVGSGYGLTASGG